MFGKSFLTTHGDLLMDIIVLSLLIIIPAMVVSIRQIQIHKNYKKHKNIQLGLYWTLVIVIMFFEYDLQSKGGIWEMTKDSYYAGTDLLKYTVYVHLFFAFTTAFLWTLTVPFSLYIYREKLAPNKFSKFHKTIGWIDVIFMTGTGITGTWLYYVGFYI